MIHKIFSPRLLGIIMVGTAYLYLTFIPGRYYEGYLFLTNLIILITCTFFAFQTKTRPFSLFKSVLLFFVIFYGLAPILEYRLNLLYWGGKSIPDEDYIFANITIFSSVLAYIFFYLITEKTSIYTGRSTKSFIIECTQSQLKNIAYKLIGLSCVGALLLAFFYKFDSSSLLLRGGDFVLQAQSEEKFITLIISNYIRPLVFNCFAVYVLIKKKFDLLAWVLCALALFAASPTLLPRFQSATLFMSLYLIFLWRAKATGYQLNNILLLGFIFVFPILDVFRYFIGFDRIDLDINLSFFAQGHFDAYQNMVRTVSTGLSTGGQQLIGVIFFFIPRGFWPGKPISSGEFMAHERGLNFSNISMPYLAEGYINFGLFGILLFVFVLAVVTATLDKLFWADKYDSSATLFPLVYMQLIGLMFFVMRGDLMNAFAYSCGIVASLVTISMVLRFKCF